MKIKIVGNGIAALMLAEKLTNEKFEVSVLGSGKSQAPPQVLVHLYAGRSFRRPALEIAAFKSAVEYWQRSNFAVETKVNRTTNPRLEKSVSQADNHPWESPTLADGMYSYGPAFVIDAWGLMDDLRRKLNYQEIYVNETNTDELKNCDEVIWATGFENNLPYCAKNAGVSIAVQAEETISQIQIGKGVHYASNGTTHSLGGAFLNEELEHPKTALLDRSRHLITAENRASFQSGEIFVGQKSVSQDRLPVIGFDDNRRFLFTAFGARAFFWLPSSCKLAYDIICGKPGNLAYSPLRFSEKT